jgi:hypothetical protein
MKRNVVITGASSDIGKVVAREVQAIREVPDEGYAEFMRSRILARPL